jgi:hypothetical protein
VAAMLQPDAAMAEKAAAVRIMRFTDDPDLKERILSALIALFQAERHPGLSLRLAEVLVRNARSGMDLDMIAFLIRAWHADGAPAARHWCMEADRRGADFATRSADAL